MSKEKVPVMYLELCDQRESGFVKDGTAGTAYVQTLKAPTIRWIPTESLSATVDEKGVKRFKKIRHIKGCEIIDPQEQEKRGFMPNRFDDKIPFEVGFATIYREGSTIGTYDYLREATIFADNPERPEKADKVYRELKAKEKAVGLVNDDEEATLAKTKVYALRSNTGSSKDKIFKYDENKIDTYCSLLNLWAESPEEKIVQLLGYAIGSPRQFLEIIVKAENTVVTDVSQALHYGVIMFDGNTAQYTEESKLITVLGTGKMSDVKKIETLSNYLQTSEGTNALTELRAKLELAKEKDFQK